MSSRLFSKFKKFFTNTERCNQGIPTEKDFIDNGGELLLFDMTTERAEENESHLSTVVLLPMPRIKKGLCIMLS